MNQNEIAAELNRWKTMIESMEKATDKFHVLVGTCPDSEFFTPIYKMMELYTKAVAKIVGDEDGWLQWFWLECDMCRKKSYEAKINSESDFITVRNVRDLAKIIHGAKK